MHARLVWAPNLDQERAVSETQMVVILASKQQREKRNASKCAVWKKEYNSSKKQQFKQKTTVQAKSCGQRCLAL